MKNNRLWMVRAGERGFLLPKFIENNKIAIGWNELGDLSKIKSREEVKKLLKKVYGDTGIRAGLYGGILFKFICEFKKNDTVITYDSISRNYHIGLIVDDYKFDNKSLEYFHTRKVKWENKFNRDLLSKKTKGALGSVLTIFELKGKEKEELLELKSKNNQLNYNKEFKKKKEQLFEDFDGKCSFCKSEIEDIRLSCLEHFYPKSMYPELALDEDNIFLTCQECNIFRHNSFPLSDTGYPLLINPNIDSWSENIKIKDNGEVIGLTEKGINTISFLKLNRPRLIENRKIGILSKAFNNKIRKVNKNYFEYFKENLNSIRQLNFINKLLTDELLLYSQLRMLYSNAITILETYLSDALMNKVISNREHLRRFVESYKEFNEIKFPTSKVFEIHEKIQERVKTELGSLMYHNLPKLKGIYRDSLGIEFADISFLSKAVNIRHDLVHRSGKNQKGQLRIIEENDVLELCTKIEVFVMNIEEQLLKI